MAVLSWSRSWLVVGSLTILLLKISANNLTAGLARKPGPKTPREVDNQEALEAAEVGGLITHAVGPV